MIKLFLLILSYTGMIVQLINILSAEHIKNQVKFQHDFKINLVIFIVLLASVVLLSKKLLKEMLSEK